MSDEQKRTLEKQLWSIANTLRGKMNADEYKNYILGFIFYKYLSEKLATYVNKKLLANDDLKFENLIEHDQANATYLAEIKSVCVENLGYYLAPSELFPYLVAQGKGKISGQDSFILEDLKKILNNIEQSSTTTDGEDDFRDLFADLDLTSNKLGPTVVKKNEVVVDILSKLAEIDFRLEDTKSDLLGDAYEYLIGEFAAGAGKKGGEFYTPAQISRLLAKIVSYGKTRLHSVYDPTCGSGSLLLRLRENVNVSQYYGQELNPTTYNLARMNMILHDVRFDKFTIKRGDTLTDDFFPDLQAEAIVANPPFSANWASDADPELAVDPRFTPYGRLAPKGTADYAFVTHMLYHLTENGTMAIVLPHGALFRSGAEGIIRRYIIEKQNYLDAIIGLPANLFYGTSIPAAILVFKKCRQNDKTVFFIDASKNFAKEKNQNRLTNENIDQIFQTYLKREEVPKYAHLATMTEIIENDYNLNIPRYVDTFEEEAEIDIETAAKEIKSLKNKQLELEKDLGKFCEELKLERPF